MQNNFSVNTLPQFWKPEQLFLPSYNSMEFLTYGEFEQQFWKIFDALHFMSEFRFEPILAKVFKDWQISLI